MVLNLHRRTYPYPVIHLFVFIYSNLALHVFGQDSKVNGLTATVIESAKVNVRVSTGGHIRKISISILLLYFSKKKKEGFFVQSS